MTNTNLPEFKTKSQSNIIPLVLGTLLGSRNSSGGGASNARQFRNQDLAAERGHLRNMEMANLNAGNQRAQTTHSTNEQFRLYKDKKSLDRKSAKKSGKTAGGETPASSTTQSTAVGNPSIGQQFKSVGSNKHKTSASVKKAIDFPSSPVIKLGSGKPKSAAPALAPAVDLSGL